MLPCLAFTHLVHNEESIAQIRRLPSKMEFGKKDLVFRLALVVFTCSVLNGRNFVADGKTVLDHSQTGPGDFTGKLRLPKFAVPSRYELRLKPDLVNLTFTGSVNIELDVVSETKFLVFNAVQLSISLLDISFNSSKYDEVFKPVRSWQFGEADQIMILEFDDNLPIASGVLSISKFDGILNDELRGFYRSSYEVNGQKRNMAVTQFEPLDARRCFPCWDEPAIKATFKITLDVPSDLMALSNMPVIDEIINGNLKTVSFQETPIMSTYLVAVVVGLFDYVEDHTSDGAKVRVYCPVGKSDEGKYALGVAVKSLEIYKKFFAVPYALPKLDLIGIPDFSAGAMENWGLVTFRPSLLYLDPKFGSSEDVASVIAHELGHQWTGDIVTMEWWTHLWLNEGFATWLSAYSLSRMYPEWRLWTQFAKSNANTLRTDASPYSHPIEVAIQNTSQIEGMFDTITYDKGAAVLRMLQTYLSPRVFQRSLAAYIKTYSWSNANTEDLWAVMAKVSGKPVRHVMSSWTKRAGFPLITAKVSQQKLKLTQTQFLSTGAHGNGRWTVPITLCCGSYQTCHSFLLNRKTESFDMEELGGCSCTKGKGSELENENEEETESCPWIKINVNQTGFYRVKYGEDLAARLKSAIEKKYLTTSDRFGVLDDLHALSVAHQLPLTSLLTLTDAYSVNANPLELLNLLPVTNSALMMGADATPELLGCVKTIIISLFDKTAKKLGWDPKLSDAYYAAPLRSKLITALAVAGDKATIEEASRRFNIYFNDRNTSLFAPQIRQAAYVAVMQNVNSSNRADYVSLLTIYSKSNDTVDKSYILGSLTSCPDDQIVIESLDFVLSLGTPAIEAFVGLSTISLQGREAAWTWLKDNWDFLLKTFEGGIGSLISKIVSPFACKEKAVEVKEFFSTRTQPSFSAAVEDSIHQIHMNSKWVHSIQKEKHLKEVVQKLSGGNC